MENPKEKVDTDGKMGQFMMVNLQMVLEKELVF